MKDFEKCARIWIVSFNLPDAGVVFTVADEFVVVRCAIAVGIPWLNWMKRVDVENGGICKWNVGVGELVGLNPDGGFDGWTLTLSRTMALLGRCWPAAAAAAAVADDTLNIEPVAGWCPNSANSVASLPVRIDSGDDGGVSVGNSSFVWWSAPDEDDDDVVRWWAASNRNSIAFSVFICMGILLKLLWSNFSSQLSEFSSSSSIFSFFTTTAQLSELSHDTPEHADDIELVDSESKLCSW